jgi:hypothetical protein
MIRDVHPGYGFSIFYLSRNQGSKRHRILDPESATLEEPPYKKNRILHESGYDGTL